MALKVVVPLVITKKEDGSDLYLYQGASLPDFVSDDEVKRLKDEKFVADESADPDAETKSGPTKKAPAKSGPSAPSN